ncbi:GNAT family N-acetyltransferase [Rhizobium rhizogenes]|uniref:GNAT family N-acetyltransferase n=1 Tax=Rhizobium TaxID=379 RepID=UPI00026ED482|nr:MULTISPECIES: GNAT family N-acetyltransferase [Rhizobium]EJK81962.1 acetyltransferase [Rhizobium sp. AP16]NTF87345.1 GNAT family N-acetyltransferase [Rhizobium rhizogenes]NTG41283.1 GNAT family N-acetyltransferase [Rhizobium rhizogenes]QRM37693.1 GNAT family N-acetyltransferase [Rhizobium rhizogenes]
MAGTISLRKLDLVDMPAAAGVHRAAFDDRLPTLSGLHTSEEDVGFWSAVVFKDCQIWGAEEGGRLVGVIAFLEDWIDQLYVLPEAQGRGIGTRLLEVAKAAYPSLSLWTFQRNVAARHFYEKHGFLVVDESDGAGNEEKEPDVLYKWEARLHRL